MSRTKELWLDCGSHGKRLATVVCKHMVGTGSAPVGFVENSNDPRDLQAWCHACEAKWQKEGDMTEAFLEFNGMVLICVSCYAEAKSRHAIKES